MDVMAVDGEAQLDVRRVATGSREQGASAHAAGPVGAWNMQFNIWRRRTDNLHRSLACLMVFRVNFYSNTTTGRQCHHPSQERHQHTFYQQAFLPIKRLSLLVHHAPQLFDRRLVLLKRLMRGKARWRYRVNRRRQRGSGISKWSMAHSKRTSKRAYRLTL